MSKSVQSQLDRSKDATRELEEDDDEAKSNEELGQLVNDDPETEGCNDGN